MTDPQHHLNRRDVLSALMAQRGDALVVTGLGAAAWDMAAVDERPENFYLWGGMGGAAMIGLGLAQAQPDRKVWVVTGDGEMLMGLSSLATIGVKQPQNLAIIVIDNEHYGETGMQETHTGHGVNIPGIARESGFNMALTIEDSNALTGLSDILEHGPYPLLASVKVDANPVPLALPPRDGTHIKNRFRTAVLGEERAFKAE